MPGARTSPDASPPDARATVPPGPRHAPQARLGAIGRVREWLFDWRDRRLTDPRWLRTMSRLPLVRRLARRESDALFTLVVGFTHSQVLVACVRLGLVDTLAREGPQTTETLATRWSMPRDAAERLLHAAASLRLVDRRAGGRWGLGRRGAPIVAQPAIAAMVEHHAALYRDLADPVALLRGRRDRTALADWWPYVDDGTDPRSLDDARIAPYSALMSSSQPLVAAQVLDAYPLHRHDCLLDVGGGEGVFVQSVAEHDARPRLMLFDLPAVAARARRRLDEAGLGTRVTVHGGSFFDDALPGGADVVTLVRVLFDHPDDRVSALLRQVRAVLPPGGTLLVAEPMADDTGAHAPGDAYYALYLLAMGHGRLRTPARIGELLTEAGFDEVRECPTPLPVQARVLVARAAGIGPGTSVR